ncbi:histidine kinase [Nostoc sp. FACHB-87]|uniref:general stress protein n=1 Tax=Nostocaceae TaxID=1162 RepID=UPI00168A0CAC|nr:MULTISPECIES: general stress protein [Nostocaceae]MBD2454294.1 histidine kinase [Nostoc sp. FACHB-87]MBD2474113.1 histidine kinase [Anabaena sp. FACHB-83]
MVAGVRRRSIGVFSNRRDAEEALHELRNSGFPMDRVSVIARDADGKDEIAGTQVSDRVGDKSDEGAAVGAATGGALGGLTGLLVGLGTLAIPGIGPIMLAGATATAIATTIAGAGIGAVAGSLIGALIGLGIPEERARVYNERVQSGGYLVIVDGTDDEIARAEAILHRRGIEEYGIYNHPHAHEVDPTTSYVKHALGYFSLRQDAEAAINDLRVAGFPLSQISLIHRESINQTALKEVNYSDRLDAVRYGLPDDRTRFYNERINHGDYIVAVSGTDDEIHRAAAILNRHRIQHWQIFDPHSHATTPLHQNRRAIGVFSHRHDAEAALNELRDAGFPMNRVSLIAKDTNGHGVAGVGNKADEGAKAGAATGGALGGLGGLLVGLGALAIPGIGPVIAGGALATALATTVAGGAIGAAAGGLVGALVGLGIPEDRARIYSDRFQRGDYLVMVDGTDTEIQHAQTILQRRGIEDFDIFDATDVDTESRRGGDWTRHQETPVIETGRANYPVTGDRVDPTVTIVDRRDDLL